MIKIDVQLVDALSLILTTLQDFIILFNTELRLPDGTVPVLAMLQRAIERKRQGITTDQGIALAVALIRFLLFYKSSFNLFVCLPSYESIDSNWRLKDTIDIKATASIRRLQRWTVLIDSFKEIIPRCIVNIYYVGLKLYFEHSKTVFRT